MALPQMRVRWCTRIDIDGDIFKWLRTRTNDFLTFLSSFVYISLFRANSCDTRATPAFVFFVVFVECEIAARHYILYILYPAACACDRSAHTPTIPQSLQQNPSAKMNAPDALDAIERRIDQLNRIVGTLATNTTAGGVGDDVNNTTTTSSTITATAAADEQKPSAQRTGADAETLTDALASANTFIASAMAGRQTIADIVERSAELEHMLDPAYLDDQQAAKAREVYVNTVAPELAAAFEQLEQIKRLEPALGAEYFRAIPDVSEQLARQTAETAELAQRNDLLEESLQLAMQRYDEVQTGINRSLQQLNERIDQVEQKLRAKRDAKRDAREEAAVAEAELKAAE